MIRLLTASLLPLVLCAMSPARASAATIHAGEVVMGTVLQLTVVAEDSARGRQMTTRAVEIARHWDDVLTTWRPDGQLARLNAAAGKGPQPISRDLAAALALMSRLCSETDGAFDPGVGPLVARYSRPQAVAEDAPATFRIRDVLTLGDRTAELQAGAALDAGGIGKGIALDAIGRALRVAGASGAYLDFGGSSQLAFGAMEDGTPWTIALAGLDLGVRHGLMHLDGALSTSRSRVIGDETGPIVDPRNGDVVSSPRFVTCYAASAAEAEACSKAFIVRGWAAYEPRRRPGWDALYEDDERLYLSAGFAAMVSLEPSTRASTYDSIAPNKMRR